MTSLGRRRDTVQLKGPRVEALRQERQLTQEELGSLIGRTRGLISRIEIDPTYRVGRMTAEALASALGTPLTSLLQPEVRLRHAGTMAGPPLEPGSPHEDVMPTQRTLGEIINSITKEIDLSDNEIATLAAIIVPHTR